MKQPKRLQKLPTFYILLGKKNGLFSVNLGPVKAANKKEALETGRKLCDAMGKPEWKKRITAVVQLGDAKLLSR